MQYVVSYRWNDHDYHEIFNSWRQAMWRYWQLVAENKAPSLHERSME